MGGRYWVWLCARLVVAAILVGWAASYITPGNGSGEKELKKALEAIKQVRSVRIATVADPTGTQHSEINWDLVCAQDAYRYRWHLTLTDPEHPSEVNEDEIHVGSTKYQRKPDDSWQAHQYPQGVTAASAICSRLAQGTENRMFPDIATMVRRAIIQKGDKKSVNGVRCREWLITMKGGFSGLEHDTLCLGVDDHLPYEMTVDYDHSRTTFTDYNSAFQIDLPAAALQNASAGSTSN